MGDVLEVSLQSGQESHVVLGLGIQVAQLLAFPIQVGVSHAFEVLQEHLDPGKFELLIDSTVGSTALSPVVYLCQRAVTSRHFLLLGLHCILDLLIPVLEMYQLNCK